MPPTSLPARRAADALLIRQREDGTLCGRYDSNWEPAANYSCLTGNAQMGNIWGRSHQHTGEAQYYRALSRANQFLRTVQWYGTGNQGLTVALAVPTRCTGSTAVSKCSTGRRSSSPTRS